MSRFVALLLYVYVLDGLVPDLRLAEVLGIPSRPLPVLLIVKQPCKLRLLLFQYDDPVDEVLNFFIASGIGGHKSSLRDNFGPQDPHLLLVISACLLH